VQKTLLCTLVRDAVRLTRGECSLGCLEGLGAVLRPVSLAARGELLACVAACVRGEERLAAG
jgi:hypothetical protein